MTDTVRRVTTRITFAMPFYSGLGYLDSALRSLQHQTIAEWKAVVVDDAGPESAEGLVARFADPRISYVRNDVNLGLAGNWNKALSLADTKFVTIFHCDDELETHYVSTMTNLMDRHPQAVAGHCRVQLIDDNGQPTRTLADAVKGWLTPRFTNEIATFGDSGLRTLARANWIFCPTLCFRRAMLPAAPFDARWQFVVDLDAMKRLIVAGHTIVGTSEVAYRYRRHHHNQTRRLGASFRRHDEELEFAKLTCEEAAAIDWNLTARTSRRAAVVRANLLVESAIALGQRDTGRFRGALRRAMLGRPPAGDVGGGPWPR